MLVEPATPNEYDAVRALDCEFTRLRDRVDALREWIAKGECLVARDNGEILGFAIANTSFFAQCFIVLLVVHGKHRRKGVASALIRSIEAHSPTPKIFTSTNQSNTAMQAVCDSLGFKRSGIIENLDDGDPEIVYFKRLR
jgi:ribosomal protein S18 acetylase RimI-like enzyme